MSEQNGFSFSQSIYYEIGLLKKMLNVRVIEFVDLVDNYTSFAIRFELFFKDEKTEEEFFHYVNVGAEEIDQLLYAMKTISEKFHPSKIKNYSEVLFTSSAGFITGCFWVASKEEWYLYIRLTNEIG